MQLPSTAMGKDAGGTGGANQESSLDISLTCALDFQIEEVHSWIPDSGVLKRV